MLPIVASIVSGLISNGLPKVADAVLEKGVDYVEKELGVKLKPEEEMTKDDAKLLQERAMQHEEFMAELDAKDRTNARDMQREAMKSDDWLVRRFIYLFAIFWSLFSATYIGLITFGQIPAENMRFADTILGFLLGTIVATMISFFYGSSAGSRAKDEKKKGEDK